MQRNTKPPAPNTVGSAVGRLGPARWRRCREAEHPPVREGDVDLTFVAAQFAATASIPMRGRPTVPRSSTTQKLTESTHFRVLGPLGEHVFARRVDAAGQINQHLSFGCKRVSSAGVVGVTGERGRTSSRSMPNSTRVGCELGSRSAAACGPPAQHPLFEFVADRLAQPGVQAGTSRIGSACIARKSMS